MLPGVSQELERIRNMKKAIAFAVIAAALIYIIRLAYFRVPVVSETVATYTDEDFTKDNIYSDIESLAERLDEEILGGAEAFTVYLKDMDAGEIDNINHALNGIYGSGATYQKVGGFGDNYQKVEIHMKRNVNYYVLKAYKDNEPISTDMPEAKALYGIVKGVINTYIEPGMTDYDKELAVHDYLVKHCHYSSNPNQDSDSNIYRAYGALVDEDAVCNGYAEAIKLIFDCIGMESKMVVGTADGIDHAWNLVKIGENWYHLDATWDDPLPDQGDKIMHPYFNVSDDILSNNHTWNQSDYPKATDMQYNYYVYNNRYFSNFDDYKSQAYVEMMQHGNDRYEAVIENFEENDDEMQFLFDGSFRYSSINWQTFESGKYRVLVLEAK